MGLVHSPKKWRSHHATSFFQEKKMVTFILMLVAEISHNIPMSDVCLAVQFW
jgi:hypothetical protein